MFHHSKLHAYFSNVQYFLRIHSFFIIIHIVIQNLLTEFYHQYDTESKDRDKLVKKWKSYQFTRCKNIK